MGRQHDCTYRALLEQTPAITYLADYREDYELRYMSPQIEDLLGFPAVELTALFAAPPGPAAPRRERPAAPPSRMAS